MDHLVNLRYNEAIETFEEMLERYQQENGCENAILLLNIAYSSMMLGLTRKCIKICNHIVDNVDSMHLQAYILLGKAYKLINNKEKSIEVWRKGLLVASSNSSQIFSILDVIELRSLLNNQEVASNNVNSENTQSTSTPLNNKEVITTQPESNSSNKNETISPSQPVSNNKNKIIDSKPSNREYDVVIQMHNLLIGSGQFINPTILTMVRKNLAHASGDELVDDLIAYAYLQVNVEQLDSATEIFTRLLQYNTKLPASYIGLGSIHAMKGEYEKAIDEFSHAISADSTLSDAWKRRGQTYAANGNVAKGLHDLTKALDLGDDPDIYYQRGLVYHQTKNYRKALLDFRAAEAKGVLTASLYNYIGMCEGQLGNVHASLYAHQKSYEIEPNFKEAILNYGQMYKEMGCFDEANKSFLNVLKIDPLYPPGHSYRALLMYGVGNVKEAYSLVLKCIQINPDISSLSLAAVCCQSLGNYKLAVTYYNQILEVEPTNYAWFQREIVYFLWSKLDTPLISYNIDRAIDPLIKEGWSKRLSCASSAAPIYASLTPPDEKKDTEKSQIYSELREICTPYGVLIQLNCQGFLPNKRQFHMFSVATVQMIQNLQEHVRLLRESAVGLVIPSAMASVSSSEINRIFQWTDFFDIIVKWRQISEPNDAVWWINALSTASFKEGFGLQTPIINGQLKAIRYYSYFEKAFVLSKRLLLDGYYDCRGILHRLTGGQMQLLPHVATIDELYNLIGGDFYVIVPCKSIFRSPMQWEGTRLTLLATEPEGFEYTIRTPSTPSRWQQCCDELEIAFNKLIQICLHRHSDSSPDDVVTIAMEIFYLWVTFAPLSRGTAACGYAALTAILGSCGYVISSPLPPNIQLDWEAIFAADCAEFIATTRSYISIKPDEKLSELGKYSVNDAVPTLRSMVQYLLL